MALAGAALIAAGMLFSCTSKAPKSLVTPPNAAAVKAGQAHREPVRGVWLTTVSRLDWPPVGSIIASTPESRITQQKLALIAKLDNLQRTGINTVFSVKPDGTALWRSDILPWSDMLTGKIGEYRYDPLQFMLDEAHKRGMKVHAWFNPYRVSVNTKPSTIAELNNTLTRYRPACSSCTVTGSAPPAIALFSTRAFPKRVTGSPASSLKWCRTTRLTACSSMTISIPKPPLPRLTTTRLSAVTGRAMPRRATGGGITPSSS